MENKKKIAVFFGERSFEHDISILTGLQAFRAIDTTKYEPFPVYVDLDGKWWVGEKLLDNSTYPLTKEKQKTVTPVEFKIGGERAHLLPLRKGLFKKAKPIYFDFAFLAFHGGYGEDGLFQGLMETAGIPYSGCRPLAASVFMDKIATKRICKAIGVPVLDDVLIKRPEGSDFFDVEKLAKGVKFKFPVIVKPCSLGSSIGVSKANNKEELYAAILKVFALDSLAMVEPFVPNLEEYNVSVCNAFGETRFSAIERPIKNNDAVLSFEDKYKAGGKNGKMGKMGGAKTCGCKGGTSGRISAGMLAMTRALNPDELSKKQVENIKTWAAAIFNELRACGNARIDFLCDTKTGQMWLGEVNPIPGSLSYFLWEAAEPKVGFTKLVNALIEEGFRQEEKYSDFLKTISDNRIFK